MATLIGDFRKPVDPNALAAKGLSGALRYWTKQHGSDTVVGITAAEVARYRAANKPLGTIYEDSAAGWMSGGAAAGKQAATYLLGQFKAVGWTPSSLYFADDANTITNAATNACLDAAAQVFGWKPDLYAFDAELASAHSGGHSRRSWLTGHFPGATVAAVQKAMPWLHLYQCQGSQPKGIPTTVTVSGVTGDVDIVLRDDWNAPMTALDNTDPSYVALTWDAQATRSLSPTVGGTGSNSGAENRLATVLAAIQAAQAAQGRQLAAIQATLATEEAELLAAIGQAGQQVSVSLSDDQVAALAAPITSQLAGLPAAVRQAIGTALVGGQS